MLGYLINLLIALNASVRLHVSVGIISFPLIQCRPRIVLCVLMRVVCCQCSGGYSICHNVYFNPVFSASKAVLAHKYVLLHLAAMISDVMFVAFN